MIDNEEFNQSRSRFAEWFARTAEDFDLICYYIKSNKIEDAYELANKYKGNQLARELTLYLINCHDFPFEYDPLEDLNYVPKNYLYEGVAAGLIVYLHNGITEIRDNAFAYCSIAKLIISKSVKRIGDKALCLNAGEICYEGTKQEFINLVLGRSKCFDGSRERTIKCIDGEIVIN